MGIIVVLCVLIAWLMYVLCAFSGMTDDEEEQNYNSMHVTKETE